MRRLLPVLMAKGYDNGFGAVPGHVPGSSTQVVPFLGRVVGVVDGVVCEPWDRRLVVGTGDGMREAGHPGWSSSPARSARCSG